MITEPKNYLKLQDLHEHIKKENTGTPCSLSDRLRVSRRPIFYMVDDLRVMGAHIKYCRKKQTYYYTNNFDLKIEYKVTIITNGEAKIVEGGCSLLIYFLS